MKLIFRCMGEYAGAVWAAITLKLMSALMELMLPYILEWIIDDVVPTENLTRVLLWGGLMFVCALLCWLFNICANYKSITNAHHISYDLRQALFQKTICLSGPQFDALGLPSLISRMTSDSYHVQSAVQQLQGLCIRSPMILLGGVAMMLMMDWKLASILLVSLPVLIGVTIFVSYLGIPMYRRVQQRLDTVVRIMRENITGIRVVKALSKTEYEKKRFDSANREMTESDIRASLVMAIPGPFMRLCLNIGLTLVVLLGSRRVNAGTMEPGVILAFLTYFNMIAMGVMGLNRIFLTISKASASANRINEVLQTPTDQRVLPMGEERTCPEDAFIRFDHVTFNYDAEDGEKGNFAGAKREKALEDISFSLRRGESLGIIGPTGCGKTTIVNLLMRFYDPESGTVSVDGRDVRTYRKDELRRKFGVVFQNDMIFQDTLRENVNFGRGLPEQALRKALNASQAEEYVDSLAGGMDHMIDIKGANLSGGQRQRLLVARALAGNPEILVLDDSSSALDYRTDAAMRQAIREQYSDSTTILIAQRVSSVMHMTHILVMENGRCIGYGSHNVLLETCPAYREIYETQMGSMG